MPAPRFHLPDLLALAIQDRRDAGRSRRELLARDKPPPEARNAGVDLRGWVRRVDRGEARAQALSLTRTAAWGASLAGVLLGVGVASAALAYDGSRPVNVLVAAAALAVLPLGFSVLSVIAMAWPVGRGGGGAEPGGSPLTPGRWLVGLAARVPWLPTLWREVLTRPLAGLAGERVLLGPTLRWWALSLSQLFGLGYAAAGLLTAVFLVATRDLAFGWGSTLELDPGELHAVAEAAVWFAPGLCPTAETVELTRTYRAVSFRDAVDPELFTAWWPWLLAVQAAYGLAPRLVLAGVAFWRRRAAVEAAAQAWPGADAVLRRLREPAVATRAVEAPAPAGGSAPAQAPPAEPREEEPEAAAATLAWAEAPAPADALPVGGRRSLDEDLAAVAEAADRGRAAGAGAPVRVYVKAWEPPVLEFTDFLADLRGGLGRGRPVRVTPRVRGEADADDVAVWADRLAAAGDPWLRVEPAEPV